MSIEQGVQDGAMRRSYWRLILAAALYALSAGVILVVLVYEPKAAGKVGLFLLACALVTGGTLALPGGVHVDARSSTAP